MIITVVAVIIIIIK